MDWYLLPYLESLLSGLPQVNIGVPLRLFASTSKKGQLALSGPCLTEINEDDDRDILRGVSC